MVAPATSSLLTVSMRGLVMSRRVTTTVGTSSANARSALAASRCEIRIRPSTWNSRSLSSSTCSSAGSAPPVTSIVL